MSVIGNFDFGPLAAGPVRLERVTGALAPTSPRPGQFFGGDGARGALIGPSDCGYRWGGSKLRRAFVGVVMGWRVSGLRQLAIVAAAMFGSGAWAQSPGRE